jgi:2-polyprenyl-3-methyl-5-hydroxy-6-metoxy-1,4-benzoquinol methylase
MVWDPFHLENTLSQYEKSYFVNDNPKGGYSNYFEGMKINRKTFNIRLRHLSQKISSKKNLLDLGSALGDFLLEAKSLGWTNTLGIEPSKYACQESRKRGIKAICSTLEEAKLEPNQFNAVTSQDVLEHVTDPISHLKKIYQVLKPKGYLFIVTPNIQSCWSKILGSRWYHYKPGEHINYFSPSTVTQALTKAGFINIKVNSTSHIMSLEYILNRCRYYFPNLLGFLLRLIKHSKIKNIALKLYTGEIEIWAQKP